MKKLTIKFDGKRYEIRDALEPIFLLEEYYGSLDKVPNTYKAKIMYFYFLFVGCNDEFNYTFQDFVRLLPYQKRLIETLQEFTDSEKKKSLIPGKK